MVDICKGQKSPLTGEDVLVVAAGGIADGRGLAAALSYAYPVSKRCKGILTPPRYGATGVWVGTRFVASVEAGAPKKHKELLVKATHDDVVRTLVYSGRPMSVLRTPYVNEWYICHLEAPVVLLLTACYCRETKRSDEIKKLIAEGKVPHEVELQQHPERSVQGLSCWFSQTLQVHL